MNTHYILTKHSNIFFKRLLLGLAMVLMGLPAMRAQQYVFLYKNNNAVSFLSGANNTVNSTNTFSVNTCLFNGNTSDVTTVTQFQYAANTTYYLRVRTGNNSYQLQLSTSNNYRSFTNAGNGKVHTNNRYVVYDNGWTYTNNNNPGTGAGVTVLFSYSDHDASLSVPVITGVDVLSATGPSSYSVEAAATPQYHQFDGYSGTTAKTYYWYNNALQTEAPTSTNVTSGTWSLAGNTIGSTTYATVNTTNGTINVSSLPPTDLTMTLSCEVTGNGITKTATKTIVLYSTTIAQPTITRNDNIITLATSSVNATIYYTTDGTNPTSSSTAYTGPFSIENLTYPVTVKAIAIRNNNSSTIATQTYNKPQCAKPVILFTGSPTGTATITCATQGVTIRYTTDGTTIPSSTVGTIYNGPVTGIANQTTVKAIAYKTGYNDSEVASEIYLTSGLSGTTVILNDREPHSWSYYSDGSTPAYLHSLNPADVKITYKGNGKMYTSTTATPSGGLSNATGVQVSASEEENSFVYYKTLERANGDAGTGNLPYNLIPNPFSKRPTFSSGGTTYYTGFYGWRVSRLSGVTISGYAEGDIIPAETDIEFVTSSEYGNEVDFEAVWARAFVFTTVADLNGASNGAYVADANGEHRAYERNFVVVSANVGTTANNKPATITCLNPDGTGAVVSRTGGTFTCAADTKFEYINLNNNNGTTTANNHYLCFGRGISTGNNAGTVQGIGEGKTDLDYTLRVESGQFSGFCFVRRGTNTTVSGRYLIKSIMGCDYDRATNTNNKLIVSPESSLFFSNRVGFTGERNKDQKTFDCVFKSGQYQSDYWTESAQNGNPESTQTIQNAYQYIAYLGQNSAQGNTYPGVRYVTVEGGEFSGMCGGRGVSDDSNNSTYMTPGVITFDVRIKGGTFHGAVYGGAADNPSIGSRRFIITGGEIRSWVAGGCNGTGSVQSGTGVTDGNSYIYVGGNVLVGGNNAMCINRTNGGQVFGAGRGLSGRTSSVNYSYVAIADEAVVSNNNNNGSYPEGGNVYGGSYNGTIANESNVYILGGRVEGSVFGGSYGNGTTGTIPIANVTMTGGLVTDGVYGGSNNTGTVNNVTMHIDGGQVGTSTVPANVHGGGLGQSTEIGQNVDLFVGRRNGTTGETSGDAVIYGDVYGGSALGSVNGASTTTTASTYHTNVTLNGGIINGSLYGGALGSNSIPANVFGPVTVVVNGGSVNKPANNPGSVFGCNNINGSPKSTVSVTVNKTDPTTTVSGVKHYAINGVYGGGNEADYRPFNVTSTSPSVEINGCNSSIKDVYGGGNAAAVPVTNVTINGGDIDRVFGGGNGERGSSYPAHVGRYTATNTTYGTGNTNVTINGGTINQVFGGSNANGEIKGTININAEGSGTCPLQVHALFGGGNMAASNVGKISIGCMGTEDMIDTVYCGANQADVTGNVDFTMKGGRIGNLFGGNNKSGDISGTITLGVNWTTGSSACSNNYLGNVFGGGNLATFGTDSNPKAPTVNIFNGKVSGNVYGGGKGDPDDHSKGQVTGNPNVTIGDGDDAHEVVILGSVFGGGDAGNVLGTPKVQVVEKCNTTIATAVYGGGNAADVTGTKVAIYGGTIGDVFGGGNGAVAAANVTEATSLTIHGGTINRVFSGGNTAGTIGTNSGVTINHTSSCDQSINEVYGGGNLAEGKAGTVTIECTAENIGDVYGGANQADITNDITLNITGGQINNVFGGNNTSGSISGGITVNINKATSCSTFSVNNVYGGGNLAQYTIPNNKALAVNILNGTVSQNVYGGGKGDPGDHTKGQVTGNPVVTIGDANNLNNNNIVAAVTGDVYGGGDAGDVVGTPQVTVVNKCNTSVGYVYGGGNAADVDGTNVQINGGTIVHDVFGGGHGDKNSNPQKEANVKGNVAVDVTGGTINKVFGGSNSKGNITGTVAVNITKGTNSCPMHITEVYGGGNEAAGNAGTITIGCTGDYGTNGEGITNVYGGANAADIGNNISLTISGGHIDNVFGGNNTSGSISGTIAVNVNWDNSLTCDKYLGNVFGGGNLAAYTGSPTVTLSNGIVSHSVYGGGNEAGVGGSTVNINGGQVVEGIYGGCNTSGTVTGAIAVNIKGGTLGTNSTHMTKGIFGGGYGVSTATEGNVTVTIGDVAGTYTPTIYADIYGGSALGNVNKKATDLTTVNFLNGTLHGNLYGGGLGDDSHAAKVNGKVIVNISNTTQTAAQCKIDLRDATIYGCNNSNGSPQADVNVNIYKTAYNFSDYTTGDNYTAANGVHPYYAIDQVFGGGNQADYLPENGLANSEKKAVVHIYGCNNTVRRVFGGGNAAAATGIQTIIEGGRYDYVFGGGNGEVTAANIGDGGTDLQIHGGKIRDLFGGSNASGTITGPMKVLVDAEGACGTDMFIDEFFCGNNLANIGTQANPTNIVATIGCGTKFGDVYGGCNLADIYGNVTLTIEGGTMNNVYGGSKGRLADNSNPSSPIPAKAADIHGNVTLNITGGSIGNAFGGSNINGNITGSIAVNVEKAANPCIWSLGNVYGASNMAAYTPTTPGSYPAVNIKNGAVTGSVFGGGLGATATVTSNPVVTIGDKASGHESYEASIGGDVYGGGDAGHVVGSAQVNVINKCNTTISGDVYGGGNAADVNGTDVNIDGGTISGMVFGGGHGDKNSNPQKEANVNGNVSVDVTGGTINKVFGGSNSKGNITGTVAVNINKGTNSCEMHITEVYGGGNEAAGNAGSITIGCTGGANEGIGDVYGGANAADINSDITLNITGGKIANVFGGNNTSGAINGGIAVNINWNGSCTQNSIQNVYGAGNLAQYTIPSGKALAVNVLNGTVSGNVYGGGKGLASDHTKGQVTGNPVVTIGDNTAAHSAYVATVTGDVYGGGDAGNVVGTPVVNVVNKCNTTIGNVYGGGNAADVNGTDVNIDGGTISGMVFGGGHGDKDSTPQKEANVSGNVAVDVTGGTINKVFGGSNSKGNISGTVAVNVNKGTNSCEMHINEVYGGGNLAAGNAGTITIGCTGGTTEGIGDVYGGANAADINSDITLNIKGGRINNVFGGNNASGTISGTIEVNIEKTQSCEWYVGNVYGGGNLAPYTGSPAVNVKNGTVSVNVYGGGKGAAAVVTGSPVVMVGDLTSGHESYVAAVTGDVYGGGDAAAVTGTTSVTMQKANSTAGRLFGGGNAAGVSGTAAVTLTAGTVSTGVYGGCNSSGNVGGNITVALNGGTVGVDGTTTDVVYGGGYGHSTSTSGDITVTLGTSATSGTTVYGNLYGGSALGSVNGDANNKTTVTLASATLHGSVFGGGMGSGSDDDHKATSNGNAIVNINVANTNLAGIYGGANVNGLVKGYIAVNVNANVGVSSSNTLDIFGGGLGQHTDTQGNVTVTIGSADGSKQPVIYGDIYGGSALGNVNSDASDLTKIDFLNGTLHGNIYGGGLGQKAEGSNPAIAAKVNGRVEVNISNNTQTEENCHIDLREANIYGCNNTNGSPQDNVTVNIWKTGFTTGDYDSQTGTLYAINQVFGGGNQADYLPENGAENSQKKTTVYIHGCDNTIRRVFSGGNAAAATGVAATIEGGRYEYIFGGGNGEVTAANIGKGGTNLKVHAGIIHYLFGGSNSQGTIAGPMLTNVDGDNIGTACAEVITEFFGGGNMAPITGSVTTNLECGIGTILNVYGGSNKAEITGNVTLNIYGGTYTNAFGGSKGVKDDPATSVNESQPANIGGNVTLNLYGGTIKNAFGGSDQNGNIDGSITVNVLDFENSECPLDVTNIYGGGNVTAYTPSSSVTTNTPAVNVMHIKQDPGVRGNVYGGGLGAPATVNANPKVTIGYATAMSGLIPTGYVQPSGFPRAFVSGKVYGGGNEAPVDGATTVLMQQANSVVDTIFGGGNLADVSGATTVNLNGGTVNYDVYGGGALADVGGSKVTLDGSTVTGSIYGGGLGRTTPTPAIAAQVTGAVQVNVNSGSVTNVFGCNNVNGAPTSTVQVNINSDVAQNVYGGGNLAPYTGTPDVNITAGTVTGSVFGGGNQAGVGGGDVAMTGGTVLTGLYGGCNTSGTVFGNITVNVTGGTIGTDGGTKANVHGGGYGNQTNTTGNVAVTVNGTAVNIYGDVYGGSAKGHINDAASDQTNVTLTAGKIHGDLYGGGLGDNTYAATVNGAVQVTVNGGTVTGSVYGCNNVNGAPQSTVNVDIYGTDMPSTGYALGHVFGGGNQADYTYGNGYPKVTVHNCNNKIEYVYGGGNAAKVASTDVTIYGGNVIDNVFGGCYGANVTPGGTNVKIYGGTINHVYGGNNESGTIAGTIQVTVDKKGDTDTHGSSTPCDMVINEVYGGGNKAASNAGNITIACTGTKTTEGIQYVYGGANQADVTGPITLTIEEGRVANVFGGNNNSGEISGNITVNINKKAGACIWDIGNVYGGGNQATYGSTTTPAGNFPKVNILNGTVSGDVFGGGYGNALDDTKGVVTGNPQVVVNGADAKVNGGVYGGGSLAPTVGNPVVTLTTGALTKVFGGGKAASITGAPIVNINGGTVSTGVYGGCDSQGNVSGNITVNVTNGTIGASGTRANIHGGGYGESTTTSGDVTVNFGALAYDNTSGTPVEIHSEFPKLYGDVYGGSALGNVNNDKDDKTIVNILNGELRTDATTVNGFPVYNGGNVFGGGLGRKADNTAVPPVTAAEAKVFGTVTVNIGGPHSRALNLDPDDDTNVGRAIIQGNIYGCNNTNGSPQDSVVVNVYRTHREDTDQITYVAGSGQPDATYALHNVFGGGNEADYIPATTAAKKKLKVYVHDCYNSIERVFGGSNAAAAGTTGATGVTVTVHTNIEGGRFNNVFGGGNGEVSAANIYGNVNLEIHGGIVNEFYVGSNQSGTISGTSTVTVDEVTGCESVAITEFYCGGKYADVNGNINATIDCSDALTVHSLYGGCKEADVHGNVHLSVYGGHYTNVFGGSRGKLGVKAANIDGNVVLDLYGGTMENVFGGSNEFGNIKGTITVNVLDAESQTCPLYITNIYGGSNLTSYTPTNSSAISPVVNVVHIKSGVQGNVYGGSKGVVGTAATVTANPLVNIGYDATAMGTYLPTSSYSIPTSRSALVKGSVFGGCDAATVVGNTAIFLRNKAKVFGNVYGGGNMGEVEGDTKVIVDGKNN